MIDPENPVVARCAEGMALEGSDAAAAAARRFAEAWDLAGDDAEAAIAAHYVARHQPTPEDTLAWNQVALDRALAAHRSGGEPATVVAGFWPSLLLNLGASLESVGRAAEARDRFLEARDRLGELPDDGYRQFLAGGIDRALARTDPAGDGQPRP